jgi:hypothetical protein
MDRKQLENEVFKRLQITAPAHLSIIRKDLKLKSTGELEDILERMKKAGR